MNKKMLLTSTVIIGFACPTMAEMAVSSTFPTYPDLMQENTQYTGAAIETNMGVYEGEVDAAAEYDDALYTIVAGKYLAAGAETPSTCLAGSYCPGFKNQIYYDADNAQGIESCPVNYSGSVAGASVNTQCYRTCIASDVEHAETVSGKMYYDGSNGDGVNACSAESCVAGWHVKAGFNLANIISTDAGENSAFIDNNGTFGQKNVEGTDHNQTFYGITENNSWAVYYDDTRGMISGQARCSTIQGNNDNFTWSDPTTFATLTDETGEDGAQYCYCNITGYTPTDEALQNISTPWVFYRNIGNAEVCTYGCAIGCAHAMRDTETHNPAFRAKMLGTVPTSPATCEPNVLSITWESANAEDVAANNAGSCTYGGDIYTPRAAIEQTGKIFKGWKFIKVNN